ncbi:hypothetical protein NM688_g2636 [Phlebia brevispora]|uniref:Uncharacterized protein n=1 Tax=Phlebia brevispora TaxID=194682 RepID=A0ACC1T7X8_9APHY|nr:hypothetical protein NM688_g2636 [Phlebia brevispora]
MLSGADAFDVGAEIDEDAGLEDDEMDADETAYWEAVGEDTPTTDSTNKKRATKDEKHELTGIKTVVIMSILMQGRNQHCNALQSTTGIFLHSCNTPEKVIKVLAHMGISIAPSSIHRAIRSLSRETAKAIRALGQTRVASVAFDNFDIKFHMLIPTVDSPGDGLVHLTSATLLKLDHDVTPEDLRCSDTIWNRQDLHINPAATDPRPFNPLKTMTHICSLHPDTVPSTVCGQLGLTRRGRFSRWFHLCTLASNGPGEQFHEILKNLPEPEAVEKIPVTKLQQVPLRAMDINPATVSGNIQILEEILKQINIGKAEDGRTELGDYIQLTHGDLGSFEHVLSALKQRCIEMTLLQRLQFVIFILGLFHLKMAAADAVWRLLVNVTKGTHQDATSFMSFVGVLRPDETGVLGSKPTFRQQHELIQQTLEEYAATNPSREDLEDIATTLARDYATGQSVEASLFNLRWKPTGQRDQQRENTLLMMQYLLLYEELVYALNEGDIGQVETLFPSWIHIFKATGKHKYGNRMLLFMHNLYFIFPDGLRRAIRYNCLVNPTGRPHKFRPIDWQVELLNLYTKEIYGGEGSNYMRDRILLESPLILILRSSHANFEHNFRLLGLTTRHTKKDMTAAFELLLRYMKQEGPHESKPGRRAGTTLQDAI